MEIVRQPAVAGKFYPDDHSVLLRDVRSYLSGPKERMRAIGCIAPHAGYMYSGHVAGAVFSRLEIPPRCIVLCPNHTGRGHPLAIMTGGSWRTPLGTVPIDADLGTDILKSFPGLAEDSAAHQFEHAIEVELPFLQVVEAEIKFVPLALGTGQFVVLEQLGKALAGVIRQYPEPLLIIASSDMNHYEDDATTRVKDAKAIDQILALNARGLYDTVINESISMCGFGPAVALLTAAKELGATQAELVQYATSGDVSGDRNMVVGYAGIVIH